MDQVVVAWRALAIAISALLVAACAQAATPSSSTTGRPDGATAASIPAGAMTSTLPPLVDVPEYRGNTARTGVYPGPGPVAQPVRVWSRSAGELEFSPILADGLLIVGASDGHLYALDARTGEEHWRYPATGADDVVTGFASAADGVVVISIAGGLRAVDLATGEEQWAAPGKAGAITDIADGVVYSAANDGHAYGLDLQTGAERWSWAAPAAATYITVDDGTAYVSVEDGKLYAVSIDSGQASWSWQTISQAGAAVVSRDVVFISARGDQGELYALDRASGKLRWKYRPASGMGMNLGAIGDGVFYSGSIGDGLFAFPVAGGPNQTVEPIWNDVDAGSIVKNAELVGDILYVPVADPASVIAVHAIDGTVLWRLPLQAIAQAPVVSGGMLFIADQSGVISAYAEPWVRDLIGATTSGPLLAAESTESPVPDPFEVVETFDWATTRVTTPWNMDVGPNGWLYVLDAKPSVTVIDPSTGSPVKTWGREGSAEGQFRLGGSSGNPGSGGIAVGPDGLVYVADAGNHRIQVFAPGGTFVKQLGSFGTGLGQFSIPSLVDVAEDGSLYVVDFGTIELTKFDAAGHFAWRVKAPFAGDPSSRSPLHGVAVLRDGRVLAFMDGGGPALLLDAADGSYAGDWAADLDASAFGGSGEARVDAAGNVYAFVYAPYAEIVLSPDGVLLGARTGRPGQLFFPPPVIAPDGFGYSFGPDGLVRLKLTLPSH
jgi:outer membrane protein assembly factor BamB